MRLLLRLHLDGCADFSLPELWCEIVASRNVC